MCAALKVTRQGHCAWRKRPPSAHDLRDAELAAKISEIYGASRGNYGAPKVFAELKMAIARRRPKRGCVHHSGHGSQYVSLLLGKTMRGAGIRPSMGSVSSPWDNAAMESLMGLIKSECVHARTFETRERAALEIFEYIECFYNRVRIHSAQGTSAPRSSRRGIWRAPPKRRRKDVNGIGANSDSDSDSADSVNPSAAPMASRQPSSLTPMATITATFS